MALLLDPGLGKTSILLAILSKLIKLNKSKGALIIAPKFPCTLTWPDEIKTWSNFRHLKYTILQGVNPKLNATRKVDIYLINPERIQWLFNVALKYIPPEHWPFDTLIVDESAKFKHASSARTKVLLKNVKHFTRRYIANGTPTGNGFLQLHSQMYIVDQGASLGRTRAEYVEKYFKIVGHPQWKNWQLKSVEEEKNIVKAISDSAICLTAEDHVKMPKRIMKPKYITLDAKTQKIYDSIKNEMFAQLECGTELAVESASSLATMLHQLCSGAIYNMQDPLAPYQPPVNRGYTVLHKEKINLLENLIDELNGKQLLIGYNFQSDKLVLQEHFKSKICFFNGKDINNIQQQWNSGKIRILAGQMRSIGFGLNLQKSRAHHIAIYTPTHDFEVTDQFTRRLYRRGNNANSIFVHVLLAKGLYDDAVVYEAIKNRNKSHLSFFESMKQYRQTRQL